MAQQNVGALLEQGGKRLSKEELLKVHEGGIRYVGGLPGGAKYNQEHKPDGTVSGTITNTQGISDLNGKWTIDDQERLCVSAYVYALRSNLNTCVFIFKQGDKYFASLKSTPDGILAEKQFVK